MRVLFVQPFVPMYRIPFFKRLASEFGPYFSVLHSKGNLGPLSPSYKYPWLKCIGTTIEIGFGLLWQNNLISLKIKKNDIVVIAGNPRYVSSIILILKVKLFGGKIIWWSHYRSSTSQNWRMKLRLKLMKFSNGIIFYTNAEVIEYISKIKRKENMPIVGLGNGIDVIPIKAVRKKYNAKIRNQELLFLGRTSEKANFNILIEALKHPILKNITLNVVGNYDHYSKSNLENNIFMNGSNIKWHGQLIDEREISLIANKCRIFVYPGAVGLSLIHGMAYGLPSLVHSDRFKHMPEFSAFKKGVTGFTFQQGDSKDLALKISEMITNTVQLNIMSNNCLKRVENEFNTTMMAQKFIKFIKELE